MNKGHNSSDERSGFFSYYAIFSNTGCGYAGFLGHLVCRCSRGGVTISAVTGGMAEVRTEDEEMGRISRGKEEEKGFFELALTWRGGKGR